MAKKQSFTFNTFSNGLSNDPTKWKTHGYYSAGLDLIGIQDISGTPIGGRPNVLQLAQALKADAVSSTSNPASDIHLTGLVEWIKRWDGINSNDLYAFEAGLNANNYRIYRQVSGSVKWVSAQTTGTTIGGGGLGSLSASFYYGQDANLGQLTSAFSFNNTFGAFTIGGQTPRPMKVFAGVLNIGNDRYISTVDSSGTFVAAALTLPTGYTIRSLEVLGSYLVISADYAGTTRIFLWTGGTATFQEAYDIPEITAPILVSREGRIFAIGSQIYQLNEVSYQTLFPYSYVGTAFSISPALQVQSPILGEVALWRNRILYSLDQPNGGYNHNDDPGGVWMLGNSDPSYPFTESLYFLPPTSATSVSSGFRPWGTQVGGIYADHTSTIKVGFRDNQASAASAAYGIATLDTVGAGVTSDYAYYLTLPINADSDFNKLFHSIRLNLMGKTGNDSPTIIVSYRLNVDFTNLYNDNTASTWTVLSTATVNDANSKLQIPIRKMARNIQFRFQFTPAPTNKNSAQLIDYTLIYETLDSYR